MTAPVCDDITDGVIELSKRLFTAVLLAPALLTGCTGDEETPVATPSAATPAAPAGAVPEASGELPEAEVPGGDLASVGDGGDWDAYILECENAEQEAVVQTVVNADVTADGVADALIGRTCDASTSYFPSTVEVFDGSSPAQRPWRVGKPLLSDVGSTDKPWLTGLRVQSGVIVIEANGTGGADSNACPKLKLTYRYQLKGTAFERLDRTATESATCLPIA
ncbi:hypothetical protein QLQ12_02260 [Actinoplanes sp. NEAU-A12]|uniref:Secreted protein n=1 Tax=Actinoplanes sandaracinus TaxID=3045177 RepID=A0ABT6WCG8_9ACTN|nr:hypothetical protein [Actinoplanes sandaracinus]MDI6097423.1 hypothetical protein [Actinoplanes sandaracinus]